MNMVQTSSNIMNPPNIIMNFPNIVQREAGKPHICPGGGKMVKPVMRTWWTIHGETGKNSTVLGDVEFLLVRFT
jgi:hypothetical protein